MSDETRSKWQPLGEVWDAGPNAEKLNLQKDIGKQVVRVSGAEYERLKQDHNGGQSWTAGEIYRDLQFQSAADRAAGGEGFTRSEFDQEFNKIISEVREAGHLREEGPER